MRDVTRVLGCGQRRGAEGTAWYTYWRRYCRPSSSSCRRIPRRATPACRHANPLSRTGGGCTPTPGAAKTLAPLDLGFFLSGATGGPDEQRSVTILHNSLQLLTNHVQVGLRHGGVRHSARAGSETHHARHTTSRHRRGCSSFVRRARVSEPTGRYPRPAQDERGLGTNRVGM